MNPLLALEQSCAASYCFWSTIVPVVVAFFGVTVIVLPATQYEYLMSLGEPVAVISLAAVVY